MQNARQDIPRKLKSSLGLIAFLALFSLSIIFYTSSSKVAPHAKNFSKTASLTVFTGLPSSFRYFELYQQERKTKKFILIHDYEFYETPAKVEPDDIEKLYKLSTDSRTFSPFSGLKKCGGFHPDFYLKWKDGTESFEILLCFNCHEAKVFNSQGEETYDIHKDSYKKLTTILKKYGFDPLKMQTP